MKRVPRPNVRKRRSRASRKQRNQKRRFFLALSSAIRSASRDFARAMGDIAKEANALLPATHTPVEVSGRAMRLPFARIDIIDPRNYRKETTE